VRSSIGINEVDRRRSLKTGRRRATGAFLGKPCASTQSMGKLSRWLQQLELAIW
jgi:hypothetical protein